VTALALTAVVCLKRKTSIATTADHLFAVVLTGKSNERGLKTTTTKTKNKVKSALLLDVVVSKSVTVLKLLASENETLLIRRNTFLVLNLSLHVIDGISRLNLKSDGFTSKSLNENLHGYKVSLSLSSKKRCKALSFHDSKSINQIIKSHIEEEVIPVEVDFQYDDSIKKLKIEKSKMKIPPELEYIRDEKRGLIVKTIAVFTKKFQFSKTSIFAKR